VGGADERHPDPAGVGRRADRVEPGPVLPRPAPLQRLWGVTMLRYLRLLVAFGRFTLANELAFRGNFIMKVLVEVLWLGILLIFYQTLFSYTQDVAGWNGNEYLFF